MAPSMEDHFSDGADSDEISRSFTCCVCLDLLYKPIVLACGHISCFWCVNLSMDCKNYSQCPICRNPYGHFPAICQMLHFMLLKMYPVTYSRREKQTLETEVQTGCFSPRFDACGLQTNKKLKIAADPTDSSIEVYELKLCSDHSNRDNEHFVDLMQIQPVPLPRDASVGISRQTKGGNSPLTIQLQALSLPPELLVPVSQDISAGNPQWEKLTDKENQKVQNNLDQAAEPLSIADVQCVSCKQLLFRPVALNCGHVYCETCLNTPVDEKFRCEVCQVLHPSGLPKVCLEFDHFLEEQFPEEYALRREAVQLKAIHQHDAPSSKLYGIQGSEWPSMPWEDYLTWWRDNGLQVHPDVGCDACGMCPMVGERYKCKDCKEKTGFDLCGDCYKSNSKQPGRFNQQHTPEHKFELIGNSMQGIPLRVMRGEQMAGADSYDAAPRRYEFGVSLPPPGNPIAALVDIGDDEEEEEERAENGEQMAGADSYDAAPRHYEFGVSLPPPGNPIAALVDIGDDEEEEEERAENGEQMAGADSYDVAPRHYEFGVSLPPPGNPIAALVDIGDDEEEEERAENGEQMAGADSYDAAPRHYEFGVSSPPPGNPIAALVDIGDDEEEEEERAENGEQMAGADSYDAAPRCDEFGVSLPPPGNPIAARGHRRR